MMLVMAILALVAGLLGVKIAKSMQEQKFRTEVALIVDRLRLAQNLMLILNQDIQVYFKKNKDGIHFGLELDCPQKNGWEKEFSRPQLLSAIRQVGFKGMGESQTASDFTLKFMSSGAVMSSGMLSLSTGKGSLYGERRYIALPGYPAPILAQAKKPAVKWPALSSSQSLTQSIMPEIINKFLANQNKKNPSDDRTP